MKSPQIKDRTMLIILIMAVALAACAILPGEPFFIFGLDILHNRATPVSTVTQEANDPIWERIQQNGKMVVGISPDYPPFTYVDQDFAIQGYDLALIQEMGERLNIPLEIRNMAFDGLFDALRLGQIDIAIAAISVTPERDQIIDFTDIYYAGVDAFLAQKDAAIQINKAADLVDYRVGVQKASTYEDWINTNLVTPGLMPPQRLVAYQTAEEAIQALTSASPELDLVMLDAQPAELFTQTQPVKIVGRGLDPQRFAIAAPQNALALLAHLNQALTDLQNDGALDTLAQKYLDIAEPEPLPTREPTAQPVQPTGCLDGMKLVQELNYPDSNMANPESFSPGETIQKGWRIQNTGSCTWDSNYTLDYVSSNPANAPIGGNPVSIQGKVAPGQNYDVYASVVTPPQSGRYQSIWGLRDIQGQFFGDRLWIGFDVARQATPTNGPQTPTISRFTVDRNQILAGQCVSLSWQFSGQDITLARIFANNQLLSQDMPLTGNAPNCPSFSGTIEYRLQVDSQSAGSANASQIVTVLPPLAPTFTPFPTPIQYPIINYFVADDDLLNLGQCVNLSWSFRGSNLIATELLRNNSLIGSGLFSSNSQQDCPTRVGQYEYRLRITSLSAGTAQANVFVNVVFPGPTEAPTPVIQSFTVQPNSIQPGGCVNLSWSFTAPGQVSSQLLRDGQSIASNLSYQGGFQDCLSAASLSGQVQYTLQITYGQSVATADRFVQVNP